MRKTKTEYANVTKVKKETFQGNARNYYTIDGYTKRCGMPIDFMVQINNTPRWYRVKVFQVSNSGTAFIKTKENPFLIINEDLYNQ